MGLKRLSGALPRLATAARVLRLLLGHLALHSPTPAHSARIGLQTGKLMPLSLAEFVERWKAVTLTERAAAQSHFIDLCEVLGQPHPAAADQTGESFTFEKAVSKLHGGKGFADVWKRGFFAWEYKGKHHDLRRHTTSSQTTGTTSITRRFWWSVTWTFSRSIPISPQRTRASTSSPWPICSPAPPLPTARSRRWKFSAPSSLTRATPPRESRCACH